MQNNSKLYRNNFKGKAVVLSALARKLVGFNSEEPYLGFDHILIFNSSAATQRRSEARYHSFLLGSKLSQVVQVNAHIYTSKSKYMYNRVA